MRPLGPILVADCRTCGATFSYELVDQPRTRCDACKWRDVRATRVLYLAHQLMTLSAQEAETERPVFAREFRGDPTTARLVLALIDKRILDRPASREHLRLIHRSEILERRAKRPHSAAHRLLRSIPGGRRWRIR